MKKNNTYLPDHNFLSKKNWVGEFLDFDTVLFEKELKKRPTSFWVDRGNEKTLSVFHMAAERVPAYKHFLKFNKIDHKKIKNIDDFKKIPITDKNNYILKYPLGERCWNGKLSDNRLLAMSSGTSGEPTYWPRNDYQDYEANIIHEMLYRFSFEIDKAKTLIVIGFPMGIYVSGMATALPTWVSLAAKCNATFITPGNNKNEVLRALKSLWKEYDQFIIIGHPFFVKDVVETGKQEGMKWETKKIKLMFCSEGFNEDWRTHIMKNAGIKRRHHALSTYGSSEMLLMAEETPLSIFIREESEKNKKLRDSIFPSDVIPSVFQYNPLFRNIESVNNELIFTVSGGVPLLRFNMHDAGHVMGFDEVKEKLDKSFYKFEKTGINFWKLPFLTLYGRSDHTVKFYAANIYPEHIRLALDHIPFLERITGKFAMVKRVNENMEQDLEINIELRPGHIPDDNFLRDVGERIFNKLKEINKEYLDALTHLGKDMKPKIILRENGHEKYFKPGLKPRFIAKD